MALVIDSEANLVVRAPKRMSEREIVKFIIKKERWIETTQQRVMLANERHSPLVLETGESLLYLGESYMILRERVSAIGVSGTRMLVPEQATKDDLAVWMKYEAQIILTERVKHFAEIMGLSYSSIKTTGAKTRWGSCSAKNNLNFAWRLVMCPLEVIDYIVVHELSHITHKNHGPDFWGSVEDVLPHYNEQRKWLKKNRGLMEII